MPSITGVRVKLTGNDGNAFMVLGRVKNAMKHAGIARSIIDAYVAEATKGDYNDLLAATMRYVEVE
jgi:hypothetical protein